MYFDTHMLLKITVFSYECVGKYITSVVTVIAYTGCVVHVAYYCI